MESIMLYQKFISLVEEHSALLTERWVAAVKKNPATEGYCKIPTNDLSIRIFDVYDRLGKWLLDDNPDNSMVAKHFIQIGKERKRESINTSEVIFAIILAKNILWEYVMDQVIISSALDIRNAMEFNQKVNKFFDKAIYFITIGIEDEQDTGDSIKLRESFIQTSVNSITNWIIKEKV